MTAEVLPLATDTYLDPPRFVPIEEHELALADVRKAQRERDALVRRVRRLQRNVSQARKLVEQLETAKGTLAGVAVDDDVQRTVNELARWVGRLASIVVVQGASLAATRRGSARADEADVDESLSRVADRVPEPLANQLWQARDHFVTELEMDPDCV